MIAGPLSGLLLQLDGVLGLRGWEWLLVLEGIPPILLGLAAYRVLPDRLDTISWLNHEEKVLLAARLRDEAATAIAPGEISFGAALKSPLVWVLGLIYLPGSTGAYSITMWLPQIIRQLTHYTVVQTSFLSSIPFIFAAVGMMLFARHSDRSGERQWHLVLAIGLACLGLLASALAPNPLLTFIALCVVATGMWSFAGVFWAVPAAFLSGNAAVGGLALISSLGSIGGFCGPYLVGLIRNLTPDYSFVLIVLAALLSSRIGAIARYSAAR